jgi:hypothetical protein
VDVHGNSQPQKWCFSRLKKKTLPADGSDPQPAQFNRTGDFIFGLWHGDIMKAIRQILLDRMLATALAVALGYLLAFQGFTGNMTRASTVIVAQEQIHVLCSSNGVFDAQPDSSDKPLKRSADCPCASLCRLAHSVTSAILSAGLALQSSLAQAPANIVFPVSRIPEPPRRGLLPDARAPPSIA